MIDGQNNSGSLTVDSAAAKIRGLFSHEEDNQPDESQPSPETEQEEVEEQPETTPEEQPEQLEESEETVPSEEEVDEEPVQPRTRKIKIDGKDVEVTDDELEKGY